jgi:hypothetical protein
MKYSYLLVFALFIAAGCSSSGSSTNNSNEMKSYKRQLDSLNQVKKDQQRILDSLENESRVKEEQLKRLQLEQDSLNQILKEINK